MTRRRKERVLVCTFDSRNWDDDEDDEVGVQEIHAHSRRVSLTVAPAIGQYDIGRILHHTM